MKNWLGVALIVYFTLPRVGESVTIFNGKDLSGWEGDPQIWRVEDGSIVGRVEEGTRIDDHTYLIWQRGIVQDFELSLKFRSDAGNSGIDYRAQKISQGRNGQALRWTIQGYQADIVQNWMGSFYNWSLAGAQPGQFAIVTTPPVGKDKQMTNVFPLADPNLVAGATYYRPGQWNDYTITARGMHMIHRVNGFQTVEIIDLSSLKRRTGHLGLQVHAGQKKQVHRFKDIRVERFDCDFGRPVLLYRGSDASILEVVDPATVASKNGLAFTVQRSQGPALSTTESFADCILKFQFRRNANKASVWLRMSGDRGVGVTRIGSPDLKIEPSGDFGLQVIEVKRDDSDPFHFDPNWADCEIAMVGTELQVKINGELRARAIHCEYISGKLGLGADGTKTLRNAVLIPVGE